MNSKSKLYRFNGVTSVFVARIYDRMLEEIKDPKHPEHLGTFGVFLC